MCDLWVEGGRPLKGSVRIQGSKNAALPCMAASLLQDGVSVLRGCPRITDVHCMEEILHSLGVKSWWEEGDLYLDCAHVKDCQILPEYAGAMRSSVTLLAPLLTRCGHAGLGQPGGCVIGRRPIDMHLALLGEMGAGITESGEWIRASCEKLHGAQITFRGRSVGATEQGILAAVCARGETMLYPCAREPEIVCLCRFLRQMGACIEGEGSERIRIIGREKLHGTSMQIPPDRIVAGTYLLAGAATRGIVELIDAPIEELGIILEVYQKMGGQYQYRSGKLIANSADVGNPVPFLETAVYPGFPTDLQSPLLAALATVPGESRIRESIFEDRFKAAKELSRFGAGIRIEGRDAIVTGDNPLVGCEVTARELRGGAALVVAALAARGETRVKGYSYILRGYEDICRDLTALGGSIRESTGTEIYE